MKYLGIDFGLRRIGLAVSEGELASSYGIIEGQNLDQVVKKVEDVIKREGIEVVIIGQPESGPVVSAVEKFQKKLEPLGLEINLVDETLSTQNAQKLLLEMGLKKKKRRVSDSQAAAEILQNYLDELKQAL